MTTGTAFRMPERADTADQIPGYFFGVFFRCHGRPSSVRAPWPVFKGHLPISGGKGQTVFSTTRFHNNGLDGPARRKVRGLRGKQRALDLMVIGDDLVGNLLFPQQLNRARRHNPYDDATTCVIVFTAFSISFRPTIRLVTARSRFAPS